MEEFIRGKVTDAGRVVIPAELRREFAIGDGEEVLFRRGRHGIELLTARQVIERAQSMVRKYIAGDDIDLTDELLEARKTDGSLA